MGREEEEEDREGDVFVGGGLDARPDVVVRALVVAVEGEEELLEVGFRVVRGVEVEVEEEEGDVVVVVVEEVEGLGIR